VLGRPAQETEAEGQRDGERLGAEGLLKVGHLLLGGDKEGL